MSAEALEQFAFCGCAGCSGRSTLDDGNTGVAANSGSDYDLFGAKWGSATYGTTSGTINYTINVGGTIDAGGSYPDAAFVQAIQDALATWSSVANVNFQQVGSGGQLDIRTTTQLYNGTDDWASSTNVLGLGGYSGGGGSVVNGFAWMNGNVAWSPEGSGGQSYILVAMHEIGHAIGLDHASGSTEQLMNPFIGPPGLFAGDIAGAIELYGAREWTDAAENVYLEWVNVGQTVDAKGGNDTILATIKADTIYGGAGNDDIDASAGNDQIFDTLGRNTITAGANNDIIIGGSGKTTADGGSGNDILIGGKGNDVLNGGSGNDSIRGDAQNSFFHGDDVITAGTGTDFLEGGGGADRFVFRPNENTNTIALLDITANNPNATSAIGADFETGIDTIDLTAFDFGSAAEAFSHVSMSGGSARFSHQGTVIVFYDLDLSDLSANDFLV